MKNEKSLRTADDYAKAIIKEFESIAGSHSVLSLFGDWLEGQASCLNATTGLDKERYIEYLIRANKDHTDKVNATYNKIFNLLKKGLEECREDILGIVYMNLSPNGHLGQNFTPSGVSRLLASLSFNKETADKEIKEKGYVSIQDCCCGSGALCIAGVENMKNNGISVENIKVFANDIDVRCVQMTVIQFTLLDYNAIVSRQNTLIIDEPYNYATPLFVEDIYGADVLAYHMAEARELILKNTRERKIA